MDTRRQIINEMSIIRNRLERIEEMLEDQDGEVENGQGISGMAPEMLTFPQYRLVINSPLNRAQTHYIKLINTSKSRIQFRADCLSFANVPVFSMSIRQAVLARNESILISVSFKPFVYKHDEHGGDTIFFVYTCVPDGTKHFDETLYWKDGILRRKYLPIEYNR